MKEFPTKAAFAAKLTEIDGRNFGSVSKLKCQCPIEVVLQELDFVQPGIGSTTYSYYENDFRQHGDMPSWAKSLRRMIDMTARGRGEIAREWDHMTGDEVLGMME